MRTQFVLLALACALGALLFLPWGPPQSLASQITGSSPNVSQHVVINEIAWGGTAASPADEWIELFNTAASTVSLEGWHLVAADGSPDIELTDAIASYDYYLIERTDDSTVSDIKADLVCSFGTGLSNAGETLFLVDHNGAIVDTANVSGGSWPTNDGGTPYYYAMERHTPFAEDEANQWISNNGTLANGHDADGTPIAGSPRTMNTAFLPTWTSATDIVINKSGPLTAVSGTTVSYRLTATNLGGMTATDLQISDHLPAMLTFAEQESNLHFWNTTQALTWSIASLAPSESITIGIATILSPTAQPGITLTNHVSASEPLTELCPWNNTAAYTVRIAQPEPNIESLVISGVLYDGYQLNDMDEAVELTNMSDTDMDVAGWSLCDETGGQLSCHTLPTTAIPAGSSVWVARDKLAFRTSFGFDPVTILATWPQAANDGDEIVLQDPTGYVVDGLVYGAGTPFGTFWQGPALPPFTSNDLRGLSGQILSRRRSETTGLPVTDTNTAADWIQYPEDALLARRVRYPGWDTSTLYRPLSVTEHTTVTLGIAPDNAFEIVAQALEQAHASIKIEAYSFRHPDLLDILTTKARQGVDVKLLLEGEPVGLGNLTQDWLEELAACQAIENAGGTCWFMIHEPEDRIYNRYAYLHGKMIIVDDTSVIIGSQNMTLTSLPADDKSNGTLGSRGTVIVIESPSVTARATAIFALDLDPLHHNDLLEWNTAYLERYGPPPSGTGLGKAEDEISYTVRFPAPKLITGELGIELITAPDSNLRRTDGLAGLLSQAGPDSEVYVEQQYERLLWGADPITGQNPRLSDYIDAARRGAHVRILLNKRSYADNATGPDLENLATVQAINEVAHTEALDLGAALGDPTGAGIHNKMVLIDMGHNESYTHLGSLNGSQASNKVNREIAVQMRSRGIYDYYRELFRSDWHWANPIYLPLIARHYAAPLPPADHLLVTEVVYRCEVAAEWVEVANPGPKAIDLTGHKVGDAETPDSYESMFQFPDGTVLPAGGVLVIAVNATEVPQAGFEFYESDPSVPNLTPYAEWGNPAYPFALRNEGDEVLLLGPDNAIIDAVAWGDRNLPGITSHRGITVTGASLERFPAFQDTDDCAIDFRERYPSTPGQLSGDTTR